VLPSATEVFFERYYMLLQKEDDIHVESKSFRLLRENSRLSALVRHVWIAVATVSPSWLRWQATFGRDSSPNEDTTMRLAYETIEVYKTQFAVACQSDEDLDMRKVLDECRMFQDFTADQYNAIRKYHRPLHLSRTSPPIRNHCRAVFWR
jgi:hypothetical protein